ncbi:MAG TPA: signal peptidase I [Bryobacteraceae bacterium]|nr:signal peptidase I [Bryobacteraceae bacterium]
MQDNDSPETPVVSTAPSPADEAGTRPGLRTAVSWFRDLVFSVFIAIVMIVFIYQPVKVEGTSMMPTLANQERIFINKFTYRFGLGNVERGDTVVFWYPQDTTKSYIKRVIGLPGDRIRIQDGEVYVDGRQLVEDYVPEEFRDYTSWHDGQEQTVPAGRYFVLGDHRNQSSDSRMWGYVPRANIYGKAVFVYWPLDKIGRVR